ncbi:MAG TPA: ribbon-helix-helix protein, CopG family [Gammaproteobacteria bacterium]|nr:ribbon-helix-helix protein, CopG family [Gammaproteobacteria bacterium]
MATVGERLVVQLTAKEKREICRKAREAGLNVSEFVRRALADTADEGDELDELLDRTKAAAKQSIAIIDEALDFVNASNERIAQMEARAKSS